MMVLSDTRRTGWLLFLAAVVLTVGVYASGVPGGWLFDDYPNIVDNHGVQPQDASVPSLVRAALSSPSSTFKRPLASLTFALNYLASGLDPLWWKVTNVVIHLINGLLVFLLARMLLRLRPPDADVPTPVGTAEAATQRPPSASGITASDRAAVAASAAPTGEGYVGTSERHVGILAALIAGGWMLLPINLTGVLYVVQRMESMANAFVLLGLIGYVAGRQRMLAADTDAAGYWRALALCVSSIIAGVILGATAKETAVMLPLYAFLVEWVLFGFRSVRVAKPRRRHVDWSIAALFAIILLLPLVMGLAWRLPGLFGPNPWPTRDFTPVTRLLSEARIVVDYIGWTLLPTPNALSFYHDGYVVSSGLLTPWTTLASMIVIAALLALAFWLRRRVPLAALGLALFFGCQTLTATILPLELIYEHRNYFASFGLLLAVIPLLAARARHTPAPPAPAPPTPVGAAEAATPFPESTHQSAAHPDRAVAASAAPTGGRGRRGMVLADTALPMALPRYVLLGGLLLLWTVQTALTAYAWGSPLRLAQELAARAPESPRAQYELGRTYIIYSHYRPESIFTKLAYAPLERSAALPHSSILPEQALIFMNARMHLPLKDAWWDGMIAKLKADKPGVQDESSLGALTQCAREGSCELPEDRMMHAFFAALSHPHPSARLLAIYGDYAWNVLGDHALGERATAEAVKTKPSEPAYHITLTRMLVVQGRYDDARRQIRQLETLNIGGRLDGSIAGLRELLPEP